jgi:hypothetical protein
MPVQTSYTAEHAAAFEGQRANLSLINITSKVVELAAGIPFGRAVVRGTADNQCLLPTATGQDFLGITEMTTAWAENSSDLHLYEQYREANIIDFGEVWVYTEQSVVPGDPVYFRHTAEASPLNVLGRFRKDASTANADLIQGATWETTTAAGGIGKIKLNAPGTGILVAKDSSESLTAAGAVSLVTSITYLDSTAGAMAMTLADGQAGQEKIIIMSVDGGDVTVTPANLLGGTAIVFNDVGDAVTLRFDGTNWIVVNKTGADSGAVIILASGAIPLTKDKIIIDSTSGVQALTLADGVIGQEMDIMMKADGGNSVLTPATLGAGTTITFDDVGDSARLVFDGVSWQTIGTPTATVA